MPAAARRGMMTAEVGPMHEIDRARFGAFVASLRREKGMTQKDLAKRLYVSDKAVSKWELLEGRRLADSESMSPADAEALVQKALGLSESPERGGPDRKKWGLRYGLCLAAALLELGLLVYRMVRDPDHWSVYYPYPPSLGCTSACLPRPACLGITTWGTSICTTTAPCG